MAARKDERKDELLERVGTNLRRLRTERGLSQEKLALEAAVDTAHVSRIERASLNPTVDVIDRLAGALGVKHEEFFRPLKLGAKNLPTLKAGRKPKAGKTVKR